MLLKVLAAVAALTTAALSIAIAAAVIWRKWQRRTRNGKVRSVGLFHPYCSAGGGGERVLWFAVQAIQEKWPSAKVVIYARGQAGEKQDILKMAKERFGADRINTETVHFVYLSRDQWLEAEKYPRLTLIGQSLGSMYVAMEALKLFTPDLFFDTMGYAFTYPVAWFYGSTIACYTHYPTISTDMLSRVYDRRPAYNNDELVAGSVVNSRVKYFYYVIFCKIYGLMGWFPELVIVNSNWTGNHINYLWGGRAKVIFPPCDIDQFAEARNKTKERVIVSLGQFRPEKDHKLQIQSLAILKSKLADRTPHLWLFGSCRDNEDRQRVEELREFAKKQGVEELVDFKINIPFTQLKETLGRALLGVHTMWNEHFGIAPVEMMAAGIILIAHNSGGPKLDIIQHGRTGFLATSADEYAECILKVLALYDNHGGDQNQDLENIRSEALNEIQRFSQDRFGEHLVKSLDRIQ